MEWAILSAVDDEDRRAVLSASVRRTYRRNAIVFRQGEAGRSLHLLEVGRVAVQVSTAHGDLVTIGVLGPGSYFGEQALIGDDGDRMATVVALEHVETLALDRREFDRLRASHRGVDGVLAHALSERVNRLTDQLVEALFVSAETRVCRRLLELTTVYGAEVGERVVVALTQEQLAMLAGSSRPTANRVLAELARDGIVAVRRGAVDVLDPERLASRCDRA